jgi:hypothetical protein
MGDYTTNKPYCDIFVQKKDESTNESFWKWCELSMDIVDDRPVCPTHGDWYQAIKTMPHGATWSLKKAGLA